VLGPLGGPGLRGEFGKRFGPGPGVHGFARGHGLLDDVADAFGTTPAKLFAQLRDGTSLADVAKANGKSLADVRSALKATMKTRLDKAVAAGDLTQKQADAMLSHVDEMLDKIGSGHERRLRRHRGNMPPAGGLRPGGLPPGESAPGLVRPDGTYS